MVLMIQADGTIIQTIPERVYQGSNNSNTIYLVGAIASNSTIKIAFKQPQTGIYTEPDLMVPASVTSTFGVNAWSYAVGVALTQYYGEVEYQICAYNSTGQIIASGGASFLVERGIPPISVPNPEGQTYDTIINLLTSISEDLVNSWLTAKGILPYDELFTYPLSAVVYDATTKDMYVSLIVENLGNELSDTTKWEKQNFTTESYVAEQISEHNTSEQAHAYIQGRIDDLISGLGDGTIVVAEAIHAASADNATRAVNSTYSEFATKDENGNIIKDTYVPNYKRRRIDQSTILTAEVLNNATDITLSLQSTAGTPILSAVAKLDSFNGFTYNNNQVVTASDNGKIPMSLLPSGLVGGYTPGGQFDEDGIITANANYSELDGLNIADILVTSYVNVIFVADYVDTTASLTFGGQTFNNNDYAICNGTEEWGKIDNTDNVISVNNKAGTVILDASDVGAISYAEAQALSSTQQTQALENIGGASEEYVDDRIGRKNQFDAEGTLTGGIATFEPAIPYNILNNTQYEFDLLLSLVGTLPDTTEVVIDNNGQSIRIITPYNINSTNNSTVADLKQVMTYDTETGYRWIFDATINIADEVITAQIIPTVANLSGIESEMSTINSTIAEISAREVLQLSNSEMLDATISGGYTNGQIATPTDDDGYILGRFYQFSTINNDWTETTNASYTQLNDLPTLNTNNSASLVPNLNETITGSINLHKISKTGNFGDLNNIPTATNSQAGIIEIATDNEASTGTAENIAVNPKQLKTAIDGLGTVFNIKGNVQSVSDLPQTGNTIGDVYYVISEEVGYVWINTGTIEEWEQFGAPIDLSGYVPKSDIVNNLSSTDATKVLSAKQGRAINGYITALDDRIDGLTTGVSSVNAKTGAVVLNSTDVGALPSDTTYVSSVNGNSGAVTLNASDVGAIPTSDIVNNLTSTDATKPLSANMGKTLNDQYTYILNKVNTKQNTLIAGTNITIQNDVISASGGGGSSNLVAEVTVTNPTNNINITGLDIVGDGGIYDIILYTPFLSTDIYLKINNLTNVYRNVISTQIGTTTTVNSIALAAGFCIINYSASNSRPVFSKISLMSIGGKTELIANSSLANNDNAQLNNVAGYTISDGNVTQITFNGLAGAFQIGTNVKIFKRS